MSIKTTIDPDTWAVNSEHRSLPANRCDRCGEVTRSHDMYHFQDDRLDTAQYALCDACDTLTRRELDQGPVSAPQEAVSQPQAWSWGTGPHVDPLTEHDAFSLAIDGAIDAFAEYLAGSYPECVTGDVAPDVDGTFFKAAHRFATEWIRGNHPVHQPKPWTVLGTVVIGGRREPWHMHVTAPNHQQASDTAFKDLDPNGTRDTRVIGIVPGHVEVLP